MLYPASLLKVIIHTNTYSMKKYYLSALCLFLVTAFKAQYAGDFKVYKSEPTGIRSVEKLLQSLIGDGVVLKNFSVSKTTSDEAFGFFEDKKARLGMKKGLVMTTGGIAGLSAKNTSAGMSNNTHANVEGRVDANAQSVSCPDLESLLGNGKKTFDACVIELDIVPTADTLSFNYVFGSEEYDEYVGSEYNDVFAFFISGEGIKGDKNLAVVPGSNVPVSVNSINNGGGSTYKSRPSNSTFYISNIDGHVGIEYDGMTKLMEIHQPVVAYKTYHLKLAIADVADNSFDSGVLLEGHSIVSYQKIYNVLFEKNSDDVENGYKNLLDALAAQYKKDYTGKILLTGHTDNEGFEDLNKELSCNRANAVSAYLQSKGVSPDRIVVDCKGESMPAYDNNSDKGKMLNRRVEIKLLGDNQAYLDQRRAANVATGINGDKMKVLSNYPNPFNGTTTIDAYVKEDAKDASILITDMSGKTLKIIYLLEKGRTSATFDAQYLASGIYNATLLIDGQPSESIKMLVQK